MKRVLSILMAGAFALALSSFTTVEDPTIYEHCTDWAYAVADSTGDADDFEYMWDIYNQCKADGGCPCTMLDPVIVPILR